MTPFGDDDTIRFPTVFTSKAAPAGKVASNSVSLAAEIHFDPSCSIINFNGSDGDFHRRAESGTADLLRHVSTLHKRNLDKKTSFL